MSNGYTIFFVLNGFINGEEGYFALRTNEQVLEDGWYFDPTSDKESKSNDEVGPFLTKDDCQDHAKIQQRRDDLTSEVRVEFKQFISKLKVMYSDIEINELSDAVNYIMEYESFMDLE